MARKHLGSYGGQSRAKLAVVAHCRSWRRQTESAVVNGIRTWSNGSTTRLAQRNR